MDRLRIFFMNVVTISTETYWFYVKVFIFMVYVDFSNFSNNREIQYLRNRTFFTPAEFNVSKFRMEKEFKFCLRIWILLILFTFVIF